MLLTQVKHEYVALYKQYAPLWEKEEVERNARWHGFLEQFTSPQLGGK